MNNYEEYSHEPLIQQALINGTMTVANENNFELVKNYITGVLELDWKYRPVKSEEILIIPKSISGTIVKYIGQNCFGDYGGNFRCNYGHIVIPSTVISINGSPPSQNGAFMQCTALTSIIIPDSVINIGYQSFKMSALTSIRLSSNLKTIGDGAFAMTKLTDLIIPDSVETIGIGAFANNINLKNLKLSNNLKTIGDNAFRQGLVANEIIIPASVVSIGNNAFQYGCLTRLEFLGKIPPIIGKGFINGNLQLPDRETPDINIFFPKESYNDYMKALDGNIPVDPQYSLGKILVEPNDETEESTNLSYSNNIQKLDDNFFIKLGKNLAITDLGMIPSYLNTTVKPGYNERNTYNIISNQPFNQDNNKYTSIVKLKFPNNYIKNSNDIIVFNRRLKNSLNNPNKLNITDTSLGYKFNISDFYVDDNDKDIILVLTIDDTYTGILKRVDKYFIDSNKNFYQITKNITTSLIDINKIKLSNEVYFDLYIELDPNDTNSIENSILLSEVLIYNRILDPNEIKYLADLGIENSNYYRAKKAVNELYDVNRIYNETYLFEKIKKIDYKFSTYRVDAERFRINNLYNNIGNVKNFGKDMLVFTLTDFERFSRENFEYDVIVDGCYIDEIIDKVYHQYEIEYNLASAKVYVHEALVKDGSTVEIIVRKTRKPRNSVHKLIGLNDKDISIIDNNQIYKIDKHKLDKPFKNINDEIVVILKRKDGIYKKPLHEDIHYISRDDEFGWNIKLTFFIILNEGDELWISSKDKYDKYTINSSEINDMDVIKATIDTRDFIATASNYSIDSDTTYTSKIDLFNLVYPILFKIDPSNNKDIGWLRNGNEVIPYFANWTNEYRVKLNNHFMSIDDYFIYNINQLEAVPLMLYFGKNLIQNKELILEKLNIGYNRAINYSLVFDEINKYGIINVSELKVPADSRYLEIIINGKKIPKCDIEIITHDIIRIKNLKSNVKVRIRPLLQDTKGILDILGYYRKFLFGPTWRDNSYLDGIYTDTNNQYRKIDSFDDWMNEYIKLKNLVPYTIDEVNNKSPFFTEDQLIDEDKFNELQLEDNFLNGDINDIDANINYQEFHINYEINCNKEHKHLEQDSLLDANNEGFLEI